MGDKVDRETPVKLANLPKIKAIAAGYYHTLMLDEDGKVWSCGYNMYGQLGRNTTEEADKAESVPGLVTLAVEIVGIAAGNFHSIFLDVDGNVWGCGHNSEGCLGIEKRLNQVIPERAELPKIVSISAGMHSSTFIDEEGTVWGCGRIFNCSTPVRYCSGIVCADCSSYIMLVNTDGQILVSGIQIHNNYHYSDYSEPKINEEFPLVHARRKNTKSARKI